MTYLSQAQCMATYLHCKSILRQERLPPTKMKLYKINLMVKKVTRIKVITEQMTNKFKQLNSTMYEIEKY